MGSQTSNAVAALRSEKESLLSQANRIDQAITLLMGGREPAQHRAAQYAQPKKRVVSAELREARSKAQQERWKKFREEKAKVSNEVEPPQQVEAHAGATVDAGAEEAVAKVPENSEPVVDPEQVDAAVAAREEQVQQSGKKAKRVH